MIFSELYSAYYNAVAAILAAAAKRPVTPDDIRRIIEEKAFGESVLNIEPSLTEERWQLLLPDGSTVIKNRPEMPLTLIEKRWLKAISLDPRIRLFTDDIIDYPDVEPLFYPEDIMIFDRYSDGDDYENEEYISNFRMILDAIHNGYPLTISMESRKDIRSTQNVLPKLLEYSEKDDKFRLRGLTRKGECIVNLGRITRCTKCTKEIKFEKTTLRKPAECMVSFDLIDRRNALDRILLHFAHFKKQVEKTGEDTYKVILYYDINDETEMVIRILSFGPLIKVTEPETFINRIKQRLIYQKSCGL